VKRRVALTLCRATFAAIDTASTNNPSFPTMITHSPLLLSRILLRPILWGVLLLIGISASAAETSPSSAVPVQRLKDFLWREVQNHEGKTLGSVTDVLVEMPSGKIVFVAVVPSGFFERPKTLPPGALIAPAQGNGPLRVEISHDRWLEAPRIDWDPKLIVQNTGDGPRIYGYYQQQWAEPEPIPEPGLEVVASRKKDNATPPPVQYVSLKDMLLDRVTTPAWEQAGFLSDFIIDWSAQRATHALVSPQFTPLARPDEMWFAIPLPLLNPPDEEDAITVNSNVEAFRRAPNLPEDGRLPENATTEIYRYPADPKLTGS